MAGHERNVDGKSVIAAVPLSPSATLSTIVSPASPAVSAPDKQQTSSLPPNSVQAAPIYASTAAELSRQPVAASKNSQKTARSQNRPARGWYDARIPGSGNDETKPRRGGATAARAWGATFTCPSRLSWRSCCYFAST